MLLKVKLVFMWNASIFPKIYTYHRLPSICTCTYTCKLNFYYLNEILCVWIKLINILPNSIIVENLELYKFLCYMSKKKKKNNYRQRQCTPSFAV